MKRLFLVLVMLICAVSLTACGNPRTIEGYVVAVLPGEATALPLYIVETTTGERIGVQLSEETWITLRVDGLEESAVKEGSVPGIAISSTCGPSVGNIQMTDGTLVKSYPAEIFQVISALTEDAATVSDGTEVEIWKSSGEMLYRLGDGTELLRVARPSGPEDVDVDGLEGFDALAQEAQDMVRQYYAERGLLYDVDAELEQAYAAYRKAKPGEPFSPRYLSQDISPVSSNDRIMCFLTCVTRPTEEDGVVNDTLLGDTFDRDTGKHLDNWELFTCPKEEAAEKLLDLAKVTEEPLREEMEAALRSECIILTPNQLEIAFPAGDLPSQTFSYIIGHDYDKALCSILHDWAVPKM